MASPTRRSPGPGIRRVRSVGDPPTTDDQTSTSPDSVLALRLSGRLVQNQSGELPLTPTETMPPVPTIPIPEPLPTTTRTHPPHSRAARFFAFFGWGRASTKARKEIVALTWNLTTGLLQATFVITLLTIAGSTESKTVHGKNEWQACDRPLGPWAILWGFRVIASAILAYWAFVRDRKARLEAESALPSTNLDGTVVLSSRTPAPASPSTLRSTTRNRTPPANSQASTHPRSRLFSRLNILSSLYTLSWFLTAHILVYPTVNTCRYSSPHLWWLIFSLLCILYLMIAEVLLVGFIVFFVLPIVFLVWNLILLALGRHPIQNPHQIKPDVQSLSKALVDKIPLVMYIPPPPGEESDEKQKVAEPSKIDGVAMPPPVHLYPPRRTNQASTSDANQNANANGRRRFRFLRTKFKTNGKSSTSNKYDRALNSDGSPVTWEDNWEQGEHPFVRLEGNRAACAICLSDFEEPKRVRGDATKPGGKDGEDIQLAAGPSSVQFSGVGESESSVATDRAETGSGSEANAEGTQANLRLKDAGEGAQPLRLLACGHVFHKTCLDPWLIEVSGRCPVCQRPVELPEEPSKKKSRRRNNGPRGDTEV